MKKFRALLRTNNSYRTFLHFIFNMVFITLKFQKERIQIDLPIDGKDAIRAISKRVDLPKERMKISKLM